MSAVFTFAGSTARSPSTAETRACFPEAAPAAAPGAAGFAGLAEDLREAARAGAATLGLVRSV